MDRPIAEESSIRATPEARGALSSALELGHEPPPFIRTGSSEVERDLVPTLYDKDSAYLEFRSDFC